MNIAPEYDKLQKSILVIKTVKNEVLPVHSSH